MRLHRQYEAEEEELEKGAPQAAEARALTRHTVFVLVDALDMAAARAIQYARTLHPDELRAVHFDLDPGISDELQDEWSRLGFSKMPLDIFECPDRRLAQAVVQLAADALSDHETEVSIVLPRRAYTKSWHRLLHDKTADAIAEAVSMLPHANVTIIPYHLGQAMAEQTALRAQPERRGVISTPPKQVGIAVPDYVTPCIEAAYRQRASIAGRVTGLQVQPFGQTAALQVTLADKSGRFNVVFLGRRTIPGVALGATVMVTGMVNNHHGRLAMLNPDYEILQAAVPGPSVKGGH